MNYLKYLYYKYYKFSIVVGNEDIAKFQAFVMFVLVIILNIITVLGYLDILFQITLNISKGYKLAIGFAFIIFSYLYLQPHKSDKVIEQYSIESRKRKIMGNFLVTIYSILSLLLMFSSWYLMLLRNRGQL